MQILVTGGAGFIGSHLVDHLVCDCGVKVTVLDNLRRGRLENLVGCRSRIRFVRGDVRNERLLSEMMVGVDLVYHLAAQSNVIGAEEDPQYCFSTNVFGTWQLLRSAARAGVPRVVFASSREAYGDAASLPVPETAPLRPKNTYGASKAAAEAYCHSFWTKGVEVIILRLANVYGPRDFGRVIPIFIERAQTGRPVDVYGGRQILDFVWIETVVRCLVRAGRGRPIDGPVNVGSGIGTNIRELADRITSKASLHPEVNVLPSRGSEVASFVADVSKMAALFETGTTGAVALGRDTDLDGHLCELLSACAVVV